MTIARGVGLFASLVISWSLGTTAACSSFSEDDGLLAHDAASDAQGESESSLEDRAVPMDVDASDAASGFPRTYHLDTQADCDAWAPDHEATFEAIADGKTNGACRICGPAGASAFRFLALPPGAGDYTITAQVRLAAGLLPKDQSMTSAIGFQVASEASPSTGLPSGGATVAMLDGNWASTTKQTTVSSAVAPDGTSIVVRATIEVVPDPSSTSLAPQCYDIDEVVVDVALK